MCQYFVFQIIVPYIEKATNKIFSTSIKDLNQKYYHKHQLEHMYNIHVSWEKEYHAASSR